MNIDWGAIFQGGLDAALGVVQKQTPQIRDYWQKILGQHKAAVVEYGEAWGKGDIDEETFESLLDDERILLESEVTVVRIMTKAAAQKAAKAFVDSVTVAVKSAVLAALA